VPLSLFADGETLVTDWAQRRKLKLRIGAVYSAQFLSKAVRIAPPNVKHMSIAHSIGRDSPVRATSVVGL
jgi:hypothetical protein